MSAPPETADECRCVNVRDALRLAFAGQQQPECLAHDHPADTGASPLALNDTAGLKAAIGRALGADITTADPTTPLDAA